MKERLAKGENLIIVDGTVGFDIIGITETWGRDSINDAGFSIEGFSMLYM